MENSRKKERVIKEKTVKVRNREGIEHGRVVVLVAAEMESTVFFGGISGLTGLVHQICSTGYEIFVFSTFCSF